MMGSITNPFENRSVGNSRGPSTQDVIHRDGRAVPPAFEETSPVFLGNEDIPFNRYTSQAYFNLEMEKMWPKVWQWACREEHIPDVGDYYVYDIGDYSVLLVRDERGVQGYFNSCMHRGTKLRPSGSSGHTQELRCPFHGWTWDLQGNLTRLPCAWDAPHVSQQSHNLLQVRVALWGGFVFVNMDANAQPLEDYLGPIIRHFAPYRMENRYIELHIEKEFFCNWKSGVEAFIENYHTQETHPQLITANYDENTQYDIFNAHVSRFLSAYGVSSTHLTTPLTEEELMSEMLVGNRGDLDDLSLKEGETARVALARVLRSILGKSYQTDLSRYTDTEMIDVAQYSVFPNMIVFPGLSLPFVYRVRPIGNSPDRCLFELICLRESSSDGKRPAPAVPVRLMESDSFGIVPNFDPPLAKVFDQDTSNLRALQEGCKAAKKSGATLLSYQEVRIRHMQQTMQDYLSGG
jgi:nitrite reductase/ring-hydroxylating ferredoxin subunit